MLNANEGDKIILFLWFPAGTMIFLMQDLTFSW